MTDSARLIEVGIPARLKGFKYLKDAIELYPSHTSMMALYEELAQRHSTNRDAVIRNIRTALQKVEGKPTAREFLANYENIACKTNKVGGPWVAQREVS